MPLLPPRLRPAILVALGLLAALAAAVLLATPLDAALRTTGFRGPFSKVFRYLLAVLMAVVVLTAAKPWRDVPPGLWGLVGRGSRPALALVGALTAVAFLLAVAGVDALAGNLTIDAHDGWSKFLARLPEALARIAVLGLLEEIVFRGWFFGLVRRALPDLKAALVVAAVFGGLHAFRESRAPHQVVAGAAGALEILGAWAANLVNLRAFLPSFVGLSLLSLLLTAAYLRYGTLWFGVGFHGAAVAYLPLHSALTERRVERDWVGSKWLYDGVPGYVLLVGMTLLLWPRRAPAAAPPSKPPAPGPPA